MVEGSGEGRPYRTVAVRRDSEVMVVRLSRVSKLDSAIAELYW